MEYNLYNKTRESLEATVRQLSANGQPPSREVGASLAQSMLGLCNLSVRTNGMKGYMRHALSEVLNKAIVNVSDIAIEYKCDQRFEFIGDPSAQVAGIELVLGSVQSNCKYVNVDIAFDRVCVYLNLEIPLLQDKHSELSAYVLGYLEGICSHIEFEGSAIHISMPFAYREGKSLLHEKMVLIVDDDEELISIYKQMVLRLGGEVVLAANGVEALKAHLDRDFDIIFMDIDMPKMDGVQAIKGIMCECEKAGRKKPIIFSLSALAGCQRRKECVEHGAKLCLTKPFELVDLKHVIRTYILGVPADIMLSNELDERAPLFDQHQFNETYDLMGGGEEALSVLEDLIDDYRDYGPSSLLEIGGMLNGDPDKKTLKAISRIAHTVKSRSAALGLIRAADYASEVEALASENRSNCIADLGGMVADIRRSMIEGLVEVKSYLNQGHKNGQ